MKQKLSIAATTFATIFGIVALSNVVALAQKVDVRISSREAYVGSPVTLEVVIRNAKKYETPVIPDIDGCDIKSAGSPSRSSRITIINGRRSESQNVTLRYKITPKKAGTFEIPRFEVLVDGRKSVVAPIKIVATQSETGDLLFVEIEGGKEKVYVGEELDLTLKIWMRPFSDPEEKITLTEGNMWQMVSEQTSWGSFGKRLEELSKNNQRPGGEDVFRADEGGNEKGYYLYTIPAQVYPTRPGKISADDVQIVVNYPTALGRSRDPFNDFFGSSSISRRLTVSSARPIVAEANVDSTEVLPIPTEGRPADYLGAVGEYDIGISVKNKNVSAGDPIVLSLGIRGDGPMELVQAPPLSTFAALTKDFKVADQPLAGFVQHDTKIFSTSIRPRRAGITEIPSIPFSFFDPKTESFKTVYSDPISITVTESEMLALDSIVGESKSNSDLSKNSSVVLVGGGPDFTNHTAPSVLESRSNSNGLAWAFLVSIPALVWLGTLVFCNRGSILARLPRFNSAKTRCRNAIDSASSNEEIVSALVRYVGACFKEPCSSSPAAVGILRTTGLQTTANELELFFSKSERGDFEFTGRQFEEIQREAKFFTTKIETEFGVSGKVSGRKLKRRIAGKNKSKRTAHKIAGLFLLAMIGQFYNGSQAIAIAAADDRPIATNESAENEPAVGLSKAQQLTVFTEANEAYFAAQQSVKTDSAEAMDGFSEASKKYQMLVDSGVKNSKLFANLGNVYMQSGELGRAIANYRMAKWMAPGNRQVESNLKFAVSKIQGAPSPKELTTTGRWSMIVQKIRSANDGLVGLVGRTAILWTLGISSVLFWGLWVARNFGWQFSVWSFAWLPMLFLAVALSSVLLDESDFANGPMGVVVSDQLVLRSGNGDHFESLSTIESAQGHSVKVVKRRANWIEIETVDGQVGWVLAKLIEDIG